MAERHEDCASHVSSTCVYLKDGTKVVVRREGARAWLEHVPQETIRVATETKAPVGETDPCRAAATPVVLTTSTVEAEGPELQAVDEALDLAGASRQWADASGTRPLTRAERIEWMRGRIWALEQERDALRKLRRESAKNK